MGINDLLVSYKLVHAPSYIQEPITEDTLEEPLINLDNLERVLNRSKQEEGFAGWIIPQTNQSSTQAETPSSNEIVNFFMSKGLTKNQAKGIYGNIMLESGGKHNAVSKDGHNSYGLALWTGTRKARLFSKYGTNPNINLQLEFLWDELNSSEKKALDALKTTSTVEEATKVFMLKFERPAALYANLKNRLKHANSVV